MILYNILLNIARISNTLIEIELSDIVRNEDTEEQEPFLTEDSLESPPTIKHEGENISGARKSG